MNKVVQNSLPSKVYGEAFTVIDPSQQPKKEDLEFIVSLPDENSGPKKIIILGEVEHDIEVPAIILLALYNHYGIFPLHILIDKLLSPIMGGGYEAP